MQAVEQKDNIPLTFKGSTFDVSLLDGTIVTIRETNGEDDDVISNIGSMKEGTNLDKFLSGIITDYKGQSSLSFKDILKWKSNNKFYLLLKQRIFNYGNDLEFTHQCENQQCKKETSYTEDLSLFDFDWKKENPFEPNPDRPSQPWLYPLGEEPNFEMTLDNGLRVRMNILTGLGAQSIKAIGEEKMSKNVAFQIRNMEYWDGTRWILATIWRMFSSKQLTAIRKKMMEVDAQWMPQVTFSCPSCSTNYRKDLFTDIPSFLAPE